MAGEQFNIHCIGWRSRVKVFYRTGQWDKARTDSQDNCVKLQNSVMTFY